MLRKDNYLQEEQFKGKLKRCSENSKENQRKNQGARNVGNPQARLNIGESIKKLANWFSRSNKLTGATLGQQAWRIRLAFSTFFKRASRTLRKRNRVSQTENQTGINKQIQKEQIDSRTGIQIQLAQQITKVQRNGESKIQIKERIRKVVLIAPATNGNCYGKTVGKNTSEIL